jgi:hypothetical protein
MLDKKKLLNDMEARMENLSRLVDRDYNGDPRSLHDAYWELKYWKESVERGSYNVRVWKYE